MAGVLRSCGFKLNKDSGDWYRGPSVREADHYAYVEKIANGYESFKKASRGKVFNMFMYLMGRYHRWW